MNNSTVLHQIALLSAFAFSFMLPVQAQTPTIPAVKAKALDNSEATLPPEGGQRPLILVVGFSRKGGQMCTVWGKRVAADFRTDSRVNYFQIPVLEEAPSFIRPMILHGMRKDTSPEVLSHTIPVYQQEAEWKKAVNFSTPDDAYVLLTDAQGHVVWRTHGAWSDSLYGALKSELNKLISGENPAGSTAAKP